MQWDKASHIKIKATELSSSNATSDELSKCKTIKKVKFNKTTAPNLTLGPWMSNLKMFLDLDFLDSQNLNEIKRCSNLLHGRESS